MKDRLLAKIKLHDIDNPISTKELCEQLGITDEGRLRCLIHELRMEYHKIGSKNMNRNYGYFIAKDKIEMLPTVQDIRARAFSLLELLNRMEDWQEEQPKLF